MLDFLKNTWKYVILYIILLVLLWGGGLWFSKHVSDYETISPVENVECVVVSRMFNTSVDCWKINN